MDGIRKCLQNFQHELEAFLVLLNQITSDIPSNLIYSGELSSKTTRIAAEAVENRTTKCTLRSPILCRRKKH